MSPGTILRASQSVNPAGVAVIRSLFVVRYCFPLLSLGAVDDDVSGAVLDEEELGGVLAGGVDSLDDAEPLGDGVEGAIIEDDDDDFGETVGGVVELVDDVSRLQPAMPRTSPVQSSATRVAFISDPP